MKRQPVFDQYPLFKPESNWIIPTELPDLRLETEIAIDTETRDDLLAMDRGPGFYNYNRLNLNSGFVCGISLAWRDQSIYIPIRHHSKDYFGIDLVGQWLQSLVRQARTRFVFHNFQYDWGWLEAVFKIPPPTNIDDTMAMASLVDENLPSFSLDNICKWQGIPGKDERLLREMSVQFKIPANDVKKHIWEFDPEYVGPYAEQDAISTLQLASKLRVLIVQEHLEYAYKIECDLMPITLKMKQRGIRVDSDKAGRLSTNILNNCKTELDNLSKQLNEQNITIKHIRQNKWIREKFEQLGLAYPRTLPTENFTQGQASFEKSFMSTHPHWVPRMIHKIKHQTDLAERFLQKFILKYATNGRVYPTVNQFRSEYGGARSHRFSYSDPPLQQMPSRDDEYASLIRSCFIPEEGQFWCSIDYRQQEYRLIVYVAEQLRASGAKEAADKYRYDPSTDFHTYVAELTRLERRRAKDVNFAKSYGAGIAKFALMTGMDEIEAKATMDQYDKHLPFVREAADRYNRMALQTGYIKLVDGARNHFNLFEPAFRDYAREMEYKRKFASIDTSPCTSTEYEKRRTNIDHPWSGERSKRAYCHKAFNRMIQGSAARQIKKAMVDLYKAGYMPLLQLHDELCFSISTVKEAMQCAKIMEEAIPQITIPMPTDIEIGPSWGELKKIK